MEFIYDRTQADVDRVRELNHKYVKGIITESEIVEWMSGSKGALNLFDLNRIEENVKILASYLAVSVNTKTWNKGDIPRVNDYKRILGNVQKIRDAWFVLTTTPATPKQPLNNYEKWNDIERILHDLDYTYNRYINNFYYCDTEIYAGEGIGDL